MIWGFVIYHEEVWVWLISKHMGIEVVSLSRLECFNNLATFSCTHEHTQATNGLPPDASGKVFGTQLVSTRGWPTGLSSWLADHPVARCRTSADRTGNVLLLLLLGRCSRDGPPDAKTFKEFPRCLFARRERHFVGRGGARGSGRRSRSDRGT